MTHHTPTRIGTPNTMRTTRITAALALALAWGATAIAQQPSPTTLYRDAMQQVERGEANAAIEALEALEARDDAPPALKFAAQLMHGQLTGAFKQRQQVFLNRKVIDVVVLVRNEVSFLEAVAAWPEDRFYPVLYDDGWYSRMFIDTFKPKKIVRYLSRKASEEDVITDVVQTSATEHMKWLIGRYQGVEPGKMPPPPPGLVVIDPKSEMRGAGLALAIGRGQPATFMSLEAKSGVTLKQEDVDKINAQVMTFANRWRMLSPTSWCGLTLAGPYPYAYVATPPPGTEKPDNSPYAIDDRIGRDGDGVRLAVTGRLIGDAERTAYQAMCSLFLQPRNALLVDGYSKRGGAAFKQYRFNGVDEVLNHRLDAQFLAGDRAARSAYLQAIAPKHEFDLLLINSSGAAKSWSMVGPDRGQYDDMPIGRPIAIHMVHSHSAQRPWDVRTIAGFALASGAYWYFGAMHEPYLHSFVQPTGLAVKFNAGTPLAVAARHLPGHPMYRPWRLMLIGDPLFALRDAPAERIDEPLPLEGAVPTELDDPSLAQFAKLTPAQQRGAVFHAAATGNADAMLRLPPDLLTKDPISASIVRRIAADRLDEMVGDGEVDAARPLLGLMLHLVVDEKDASAMLTEYLRRAGRAARRTRAEAALKAYADDPSLPFVARKAIEQALKDVPE